MSSRFGPNAGTLCWQCKHAVPKYDKKGRCIQGCDWSVYRCKVPGWVADEEILSIGTRGKPKEVVSFNVRECPKFERG